MSDLDRLKALLRRSARDGTAQPGQVRFATGPAGVARMLEQVDAAVLGQRLCFEFDNGARLVCEASGRRLVRLVAPAPSGLTTEQTALFDEDELAVDAVHALSKIFVGLCEKASGFTMTFSPLGEEIGPAPGGVEPADMAEASGLPSDEMPRTGDAMPHEAFLNALHPISPLRAVMQIEGDQNSLILGEGGEADFLVEWVGSSLEKLLSPEFPLLATLETNGILVFALSETAESHLLVTGRRGNLLVATVTGGDVAATLNLWRKHCKSKAA